MDIHTLQDVIIHKNFIVWISFFVYYYGYPYIKIYAILNYKYLVKVVVLIKKGKPYVVDGEHVTLEDYRKTKVDQFIVRVPKGKKAEIQDFAASKDESLNGFVNRAIDEAMRPED